MTRYLASLKHLVLFLIEIVKTVYWSFIPDYYRKLKNVENQIVLITGAASGIGRSLSLKFARLGCKIILVDIDQSGLNETREFLEERYGANVAWSYRVDVSDRNAVYQLAENVKREVGHVRVLINNATILNGKEFLELSDEAIVKLVNVNLMAYLWTTKAFLPKMVQSGKGHLVYVSSGSVFCGAALHSDYNVTKWGVAGFAEALGQEVLIKNWKGVEISTVFPSFFKRGYYDPNDIVATEPSYVADVIVRGILIGRERIYAPGALYGVVMFKPYLSVKALYHLSRAVVSSTFYRGLSAFNDVKNVIKNEN